MTAHEAHKAGTRTEKRGRGKGLVERGTTSAEEIHRAVAGFPLDVLEMIPALEKPVARVRKLQHKSIDATYAMVRGIGREFELLARRPEPSKKKRHSRKPTAAQHARPVRPVAEAS